MIRDKSRTSIVEGMERTKISKRLAPTIRSISFTLIAWAAVVGLTTMIGLGALSGCANDRGEDRNATGESGTEHDGAENSESESDDGEESGDLLALDEAYDFVRKGTRLILQYDAASNSFVGTVQNTTESVLRNVRVEVHLSNGTELGPTTPVDLAPGETVEVSLAATEEPFTGWTPHAEVDRGDGSGGEHGGGEGGGEHEGNGEGNEGGRRGGEHEGGGEGNEGGRRGGEHEGSGEGNEGGRRGGEHEGGGSEGRGEHSRG